MIDRLIGTWFQLCRMANCWTAKFGGAAGLAWAPSGLGHAADRLARQSRRQSSRFIDQLGARFSQWRAGLCRPSDSDRYHVILSAEFLGCRYPSARTVLVRWNSVVRIEAVTIQIKPRPDIWLFFYGRSGQHCAIPLDAFGFDMLFEVLPHRFSEFQFDPLTRARRQMGQQLCWQARDRSTPGNRQHGQ